MRPHPTFDRSILHSRSRRQQSSTCFLSFRGHFLSPDAGNLRANRWESRCCTCDHGLPDAAALLVQCVGAVGCRCGVARWRQGGSATRLSPWCYHGSGEQLAATHQGPVGAPLTANRVGGRSAVSADWGLGTGDWGLGDGGRIEANSSVRQSSSSAGTRYRSPVAQAGAATVAIPHARPNQVDRPSMRQGSVRVLLGPRRRPTRLQQGFFNASRESIRAVHHPASGTNPSRLSTAP